VLANIQMQDDSRDPVKQRARQHVNSLTLGIPTEPNPPIGTMLMRFLAPYPRVAGLLCGGGQSDVHFAATEPGHGMTTFIVIWLFYGFIAAAITPPPGCPLGHDLQRPSAVRRPLGSR
jgi:hypothetical protein